MAYSSYKIWSVAVCGALALHAAALVALRHWVPSPPAAPPSVLAMVRLIDAPQAEAPPPPPVSVAAPSPALFPQPAAAPSPAKAARPAPAPTHKAPAASGDTTAAPTADASPASATNPNPGAGASSAAPPAPTTPAPVLGARAGTAAYATHQPAPAITALMSRMGQDVGDVSLQLLVGKNGAVLDVREVKMSEHERLNQAVLAAAKRSRFVPAHCDGEPVTSWWNITYRVGPNAAQSAAREASGNIDCNRLPAQ